MTENDDLEYVSVGIINECDECDGLNTDGFFSWLSCENCGSLLAGQRYTAHGKDKHRHLIHLNVCVDCLQKLS